jgi:nitrate reductase NapE component
MAPAQPVAPPAKSGSSALKIILIIVLIFVGLGVLAAGAFGFMAWRIAHAFHVSGSGANSQVSIDTPGGGFSANTATNISASDLGTDIYPGAEPGKGSMRMNIGGASIVHGIFVTSDSKDQVLNFYKSRFGSSSFVMDNATSSVISVNKGDRESLMVTITANPNENDGKTQISIMHSTKN